MKMYRSKKQVKASPMSRHDYNQYRGADIYKTEDLIVAGYLVEQIDCVNQNHQNHPDHTGFISWSPKEQFDNGYAEVVNTEVSSHQRLIDEHRELKIKLKRLHDFISTGKPSFITHEHYDLMMRQEGIMSDYIDVLYSRIKTFKED